MKSASASFPVLRSLVRGLIASLALLTGSSAFGQTAASKIVDGRTALAAHDLAAAQARFTEALALDPANQTAGALLGATRVFALTGQASATTFLNGLNVPGTGRDIYDWTAQLPSDSNGDPVLPANYNLTAVEAFWQGTLIPTTTAARANLALVTNPNFLLTLNPSETTMPAAVNLDYGDVLMMRASLSAVEFVFHFLSSQNLDANLDAIQHLAQGDMLTLQRVLADNPNVFKLGSTADRTAAKASLTNLFALYRQASAFIRSRAPGVQRLFMLEPSDLAEEADFRATIDKFERSFTEPIALDNGQAMFTGPLFGPTWVMRDRFPAFNPATGGFALASITDPSLGGVMAGLTREDVAGFFDRPELGWQWTNPIPPGNTLIRFATLASGRRIAVGNSNVMTSDDSGATWQFHFGAMPEAPGINALAEGNNKLIAAGGGGRVFLSSDEGHTWKKVLQVASTTAFRGAAYGNGRYVVVSNNGGTAASLDGINWDESGPNGLALFDVIYVAGTPGYFVAASGASIVTSSDGLNWTTRFTGSLTGNLIALAQSGTHIVAVGVSNHKAVSVPAATVDPANPKPIDATWTEGTMAPVAATYSNVTFSSDGLFVASGSGGVMAASADEGATWRNIASGETSALNGSGSTPEGVYFAASGGILLRSSNLAGAFLTPTPTAPTFSRVLNPVANFNFNALRVIDDKLYGVGSGDAIRTLDVNGVFSAVTSGTTGKALWGIVKQGSTYYIAGDTGTILTSPNGAAPWTPIISGNSGSNSTSNLRFIDYLNGQFVAAGTGGIILTSPNGNTNNWTSHATNAGGTIYSVAYGNGTYVAVGGNDARATSTSPFPLSLIYTSTDNGASWVSRSAGTGSTFRAVVFNRGAFTAVGFDGAIFRSTDGTAWEFVKSAAETDLVALRVLDGHYYATQRTTGSFFNELVNALLVSSDGISWLRVEQQTSAAQFGLERFNDRIYTAGNGASIIRSESLTPTAAPVLTPLSPNKQVNVDDTFALAVASNGDGGETYAWFKDGSATPIPGANAPVLELMNIHLANAGSYVLKATNAAGTTASAPIVVSLSIAYPGQIAPDFAWDPNPITISTRTFAAAKLPDGKWIVGGESVRWDTQARSALARLNADLTLDTTWTPPVVNGIVYALAVATDGTVYFGGDFTAVDGHLRPGLARLIVVNSNLVHDLVWKPSDSVAVGGPTQVSALAVQDNGQLLVARQSFVAGVIGGTNVLRRLNLDGSHDTSFSTNVAVNTGGRISSLIAEPGTNPAIAFAGTFTQVGASGHNAIARVDHVGAVDANFGGSAGTNNQVNYLTRLSDGRYLVVGNFSQIGGLNRNRIAILDGPSDAVSGAVNTTFVSAAGTNNGNIHGATVLSSGKILAVGNFSQYAGVNAAGIVRLDGSTGAIDTAFTVGSGSQINPLTVASGAGRNIHAFTLADDKVALIGTFNQLLGQRRVATAMIDAAVTGTDAADPTKTLLPTPASLVYRGAFTGAAFLDSGGKLTVFGSVDVASGVSGLGQIVRFNPNGSIDPSFPGGSGLSLTGLSTFGVYRAARQDDGKFLATGDFVSYNGSPANHIVRINPDGTIDGTFDGAGTGPSNFIVTPYPLSSGQTILFGSFGTGFTYNGTTASTNLIRLNDNGSLDGSFNVGGAGFPSNGAPAAVLEYRGSAAGLDGDIFVAGGFSTYNGGAVPGIVRIDPSGARDTSFNPVGPAGGSISGMTALPDHRIIVYGSFSSFNGTAANKIAIIDPVTGALDGGFTSAVEIDAPVGSVVVEEDGKLIAVGEFSTGPALRLSSAGAVDPTFALRGVTGFPGGGAGARLILASDGSVYLHNALVSLNYGPPRGLVKFGVPASAPTIAVQPANSPIIVGTTALLWVRAGGTAPFTYQWKKGTDDIVGATNSVLAIPNATGADAGTYTVVVSNGVSSVTSNAAVLGLPTAPTITTQPQNVAVTAGQSATFSVNATVLGTPSYQWRRNGFNIAGANSADYTIASASRTDADYYDVVVTDTGFSTTSAQARLTVAPTEYPGLIATDAAFNLGIQGNFASNVSAFAPIPIAADIAASGGYYVGGQFTSVAGQRRTMIFRAKADGTIDSAFNSPDFDLGVNAIARQSDGSVLVGGAFLRVNGALGRSFLVRLNPDGSIDSGFNCTLNGTVNAIVVQPDGAVLIGGNFSSANGVSRSDIARLNSNGTLDTTFNPGSGFNNQVNALALQSDGNIVVGGNFTTFNGTGNTANRIVRLTSTGARDTSFLGTGADNNVFAVAIQASNGAILFGGDFQNYTNGSTVATGRLARVSSTGVLDTTFSTNVGSSSFGNTVRAIVLQGDTVSTVGQALIGGNFGAAGLVNKAFFCRLTSTGAPDATFTPPAPNNNVLAIGLQADGHYLLGGNFGQLGSGNNRSQYGRLNSDATLDPTITLLRTSAFTVSTVLPLSSGKSIVAGTFQFVRGALASGSLVRMNADGTIDPTFNFNGTVTQMIVTNGGSGYTSAPTVTLSGGGATTNATATANVVGGVVTSLSITNAGAGYTSAPTISFSGGGGGSGATAVANVNGTGTNGGTITAAALLPDGRIAIAGNFTSYNGTNRNRIAIINANGTLDTSFNPTGTNSGVNGQVYTIVVLPGGRLFVGGNFTNANNTAINRVAIFKPDGSLDTTFNPTGTNSGASSSVFAAAAQPDGKIVIGGQFTSYNNTSRNFIARINQDGSLDTNFNPGTGAQSQVNALALVFPPLPDGTVQILIGGQFNSYNSTTRNNSALLNSTGALVSTYVPVSTGTVNGLLAQEDGKVILRTGSLSSNGVSGTTGMVRLTSTGTIDTGFVVGGLSTSGTNYGSVVMGNGGRLFTSDNYTGLAVTQGATAPVIGTQPVNQTAAAGGNVSFSVAATSPVPIAYQWFLNGSAIAGATNSSYQIAGAQLANVGSYRATLTNEIGSVTSATVTLTGSDAVPVITAQPQNASVVAGSSASFTVTASGTGLAFQWRRGGVPIVAATEATLDIGTASRLDADTYDVVVSRGLSVTVSQPARLAVAPNPYPQGLQLDPNFAVNIEASGSQNTINKIALAPDGKFFAVGDFRFASTTVSNVTASATINRIARFNADGSLDTGFAPTAVGPGPLLAAGVQTLSTNAGKVIVGNSIQVIASGKDTRRVVRFNTDGSLDSTFNTGNGVSGGAANVILVQPDDDKVVIAGAFTFFNDLARNRIIRLNADGSLDAAFYADVNNTINTMALQSDGKILIAGSFTVVNSQTRNRIARLNTDGSLDTTFNPGSGPDNTVNAIAISTDTAASTTKIVIGGSFSSYNGNAVTRIARITSTGGFDSALSAFNNTVLDLACPADGTIYVAGNFTQVNNLGTLGGVATARLVRLTSGGAVDTTFNLGTTAINSNVNTLAFNPADSIAHSTLLVGGNYSSVNGVSHSTLSRFTSAGALDAAVNPSFRTNTAPAVVAALPNGQLLVAGNFTSVSGAPKFNIARFNLADGSLDNSYNPGTTPTTSVAGNINAMVVRGDGKATIVGSFTSVGGVTINRIARLKATDGTLDPTFNPGNGSGITPTFLVAQPDGKLLFGSATSFTYNNVTRSGLVRILPDGALDTSFVPPTFNNTVVAAAVQPDGKIVVVGNFTQIGSTTENFVARLDGVDGSLDTSFSVGTGPSSAPSAVAVQTDGQILIGGNFTTVAGVNRNRIARLNNGVNGFADGSLDAFVPSDGGPQSSVNGFLLQEDGKIIVRGNFSSVANNVPNSFTAIRYLANGTRDTSLIAEGLGNANGLVMLDDGTLVSIGATFSNFSDIRWSVAHFIPADAIAITQQPQSTTVDAGTPHVSLSVTATGTGLSYQWFKDGGAIAGATANSVTFNPVQFADAGAYSVNVTNLFGTATSNTATLDVNTKPLIHEFTPGQTIDPQGTVTLGVDYNAFPDDATTFQWSRNGTPISGATNDLFTIGRAGPADAGTYTLDITNSKGTTTSPDIVIALSAKPVIASLVSNPSPAVVTTGGAVTLTVSASGTGTLTYQWRKNGAAIASATNTAYTLAGFTAADAALYDVVVTNAAGSTASAAVAVNLDSPLLDEAFAPPLFSAPAAGSQAIVLSDGSIIHGNSAGSPTLLRQRTGGLVRYLSDGTRDYAFDYKFPANLVGAFALAARPGGGFYASLVNSRGTGAPARARLALFANDGTPDASFAPYDYDLLTVGGGQIRQIVPLLDASNHVTGVLVAGSFLNLNGTGRGGLARFNANGTLDETFNVCTMTVGGTSTGVLARPVFDSNGKIIVAGDFSSFNGVTAPGIVRLNANGTTDTSFAPWGFTRNSGIRGMVVQSTNQLVLGGRFTVDGIANVPFIRLKTDGSVDRTFKTSTMPPVDGSTVFITSMAPLADDGFIGAEMTLRVCSADGTPNASFTSPTLINLASSSNPAFNTIIPVEGGYVAAGLFDLVNLRSQPNLVKLATDGTVLPFTAEAWGSQLMPFTFARTDSGRVLAAVASSQTPTGLADLMPDGTFATTPFSTAFANISGVFSIHPLLDGRIFALVTNAATGATEFRRSLADGTPDTSLTATAAPSGPAIDKAFVLRDGRVLVYANAAPAQDIVDGTETLRRLNLDGSVDGGFHAVLAGAAPTVTRDGSNVITFGESLGIEPFTVDDNDRVYVRYRAAGGLVRLARLNTDGSTDANFATITVPEILTDRGSFNASFNDPLRPSAGTLSLTFTAARRREFLDAVVQPSGKIIVAGQFSSITINGTTTPAPGLVRLNSDGTLDATFNLGAGPSWTVTPVKNDLVPAVEAMVQQADGRLILVGNFEAYDGAAAAGIVRINSNGSRDASYVAPVTRRSAGGTWPEMQAQNDGSVLLIGPYVVPGETYPRGIVRMLSELAGISSQPQSQFILPNTPIVLTVAATGSGPFSYVWKKGATTIDGATSATYKIANPTAGDAGTYTVVVTTPAGDFTSDPAVVSVPTSPVIVDQPTGRRAVAGSKVLFRVSAAGNATFSYQWFKGTTPVGTNSPDLTLPSVTTGDAGTYTVVVTNGSGNATSQNAVLTVLTPDNVLWQQFTEFSTEQSGTRTIHDGNGHVYLPWSVQNRNPDMVAGRVVGALTRLNENDGTLDSGFKLDPRFRRAAHVGFQSDGRLIVAVSLGDTDTVIRVDTTGAVDPTFQAPFFARGIRFVTVQPDNKVLLSAADLLDVNAPAAALTAPGIYRLDGVNGHLDSGFTTAVLNDGSAIFGPPALDSSNRIYLVGIFSSINGTARVNIARLAANGALDTAYANPADTASLPAGFASSQARAVVFQGDGRAVFVGDFRYNGRGTVNGSDRIMAIRLSTAGNLDLGYHMPLRSELGYNTSIGVRMRHAIAQPNDQLIGIADRLTRLNADGTVDTNFVSRAFDRESFWISQGGNGRLYVPDQIGVAGTIVTLQLWGNGVARFFANGVPDESFQTGGWGRSAIAESGTVLSDGRVWVAGGFNRFGAVAVPGMAQFGAAGLTGTQLTSSRSMTYGVIAPAGNDQTFVIVSPPFNSTEANGPVLARINADATSDGGFNPVLPANYVLGVATPTAASSGRLVLAQSFIDPLSVLNGSTGDSLLRLNANGSRDGSFNAPLVSLAAVDRDGSNFITQFRSGGLNVTQVLADDRVLVVTAGLDGSLHLNRLTAGGAVDSDFNAPSFGTVAPESGFTGLITDPVKNQTTQFPLTTYSPNNLVRAAVQMPDGRVYVGGRFALAGSPRGLVRLNPSGSLDNTFAGTGLAFSKTDGGPYVSSFAIDAAGRLYVAGRFDSFNGTAVPGLFRLNADGSLDTGWAPGIGVRDVPYASVRLVTAGAKLYAFGTVAAPADVVAGPYRVVDIPPPPSIATAPVTANAVNGGSATFTVAAGGAGPFTYQWFKNGTLIGSATNATYTINPVSGTDAASYTVAITGPTGTTVTTPVPLVINIPVSITTQPQAQAVSSGQGFTLSVGLAGSSPFTYQWSKDGTPITGATAATYTVVSATDTGPGSAGFGTSGDAGDYTVFVTNLVSNVTSTPVAHVTVLPPGFSATHAVVGGGYVAGSTVTITNTINFSGTLESLGWQVLLPPGWSYASSAGNLGTVKPRSNPPDTGTLSWAWSDIPESPIEFTYTLNVPAGTTGPQTIAALMLPTQGGTHYMLLAKPDPLTVDRVSFHSADTNQDGMISLTELLRVIELYNTRNGTQRTGAYRVDATNAEDGFNTEPSRANGTVVTLAKFHSADTNHDGSLSLQELLRVIELYNHRTGTQRDGLYHLDATNIEDGFSPGPAPTP